MNDKKIKELIKKLEWYANFFGETSISNTLTEHERVARVIKSDTYEEIIEIIKHDLEIEDEKRFA